MGLCLRIAQFRLFVKLESQFLCLDILSSYLGKNIRRYRSFRNDHQTFYSKQFFLLEDNVSFFVLEKTLDAIELSGSREIILVKSAIDYSKFYKLVRETPVNNSLM